jgi:hypothetical protein
MRGGRRAGAGRKPNGTAAGVSHLRRSALDLRHPVHVTMRLRRGLPSLRHKPLARVIFAAFHAAKMRLGLRLVHFSVQSNHLHHVHLIGEVQGHRALSRAMQGLAVRIARGINANLGARGSVFADRYHARALRTPREVRHALVYVLHNHKHHFTGPGCPAPLDPLSSAPYFHGCVAQTDLSRSAPITSAKTWLLRVGWQRAGPIDVHVRPR